VTKVARKAREGNGSKAPPFLAHATHDAPLVRLEGDRGALLVACAEALDAWREAGPSPASRALESVVGAALAALASPLTDSHATTLVRSVEGATGAARIAPREGPRVSTFRHGELARVWRAVTAAAAVADDLRTARVFVVAAFETRGFNPRGTPLDALGDFFVVRCGRCYATVVWPVDDTGCPGIFGSLCGALLCEAVTDAPSGDYYGALEALAEQSRDAEELARYVLAVLLFDPHAFSRGARTAKSRGKSGKLKL